MAAKNYSSRQQKIISNYYDNLDNIMLQKLQELVTELYLAESDAKWERLWDRVDKALEKLKIPASVHKHIMKEKDVQLLANHLNDWLK